VHVVSFFPQKTHFGPFKTVFASKRGFIKLKSFSTATVIFTRFKRVPTEWKKNLDGLISRIYREQKTSIPKESTFQ
jgi:hypothetical protein